MSGTGEHSIWFTEWAMRFHDGAINPLPQSAVDKYVRQYNALVPHPAYRAIAVYRVVGPWQEAQEHPC